MKNQVKYRVVIVGGGPAGIACGITLQKAGVQNCIIDKAVFPRTKLCGGLLTGKSIALLDQLCDGDSSVYESALKETIDMVGIYSAGECMSNTKMTHEYHISERYQLDNCMMEYYKKLGGVVYEGDAVHQVDFKQQSLITKSGKAFSYEYLIAADGANSRIRHLAGKKLADIGFCMEISVDKDKVQVEPTEIQLHFGFIDKGYAWVFPCGSKVKVGFGNLFSHGYPYEEQFWSMLDQLGISKEDIDLKGAFMPYGKCLRTPTYKNNVLFAGDAAGMVDAISGEGIYFGYFTGIQAAESILNLGDGDKLSSEYKKRLEFAAKTVREGRKLQNIFFTNGIQERFLRAARGRSDLIRFYLDEMVNEYHYSYDKIIKLLLDYKKRHK